MKTDTLRNIELSEFVITKLYIPGSLTVIAIKKMFNDFLMYGVMALIVFGVVTTFVFKF